MAKWPILNKLSGFDCFNQLIEEASSIFYSSMDEHERTLDPENCRDFLDLMLVEHNSMMDLFFAGMDTTSSSLVNLFLQMLHHPEVQPQVQEEIDRVVGRNRFPSFQDQVPSL
jgi:cytochrome P450